MQLVKLFIAILMIFSLAFSQQPKPNSEWIIIDTDFNAEIIGKFLDICDENEFYDTDVQKNDQLKVEARVGQQGIRLLHMKYLTQQGSYRTLDANMFNLLSQADTTIENRILQKRYKWDDVQPPKKLVLFGRGPQTVFEERDSKQTRDSFWWSRNAFEMSTYLRWVYRPTGKSYAVLLEPGFNEAGYPSAMSRNLKFGIASDITYAFVSVPAPSGVVIYNNRPLDGAFGGGFRFDTHRLGGMIVYNDIDWLGGQERTLFDPNQIVYLKKYGQLYASLTSQVPPISKKVKMRTDDTESKKIVWPSGSLRVRGGFAYNELVLKDRTDETDDFTEMYTAGLDAFRLFARFEYVTDGQPDGSKTVSLAYQINLWNQYETYLRATYRILPLMELGLIMGLTSDHSFYNRTNDISGTEIPTVIPGGLIITPILTMVF